MAEQAWNCGMSYIGIRLISSLKFLDFDDIETAKPCVRTLNGYKGCKLFLANIELVSDILKIEPGDRNYRQKFSENYKTLFPDKNKRMYRVDVLEAAIEGYTSIWVNGEKFEFKSEVILNGKALYENWLCLVTLIIQLKDLFEGRIREDKHSNIFEPDEDDIWKNNVVNALRKFDNSWITFEESYINELISIEIIARRFILNIHNYIINKENSKKTIEAHKNENILRSRNRLQSPDDETSSIERQEEIKGVFNSTNGNFEEINDCTNTKVNVREKICYEYLDTTFFDMIKNLYHVINIDKKESVSENINFFTWKLLMQISKQSADTPHGNISVFGAISENCISELTCLIERIKEICEFPERIDPHICNNTDLQQRIVKLEDSWRLANKFLSKLTSFDEESVGRLSLVKLVKFVQEIFRVKEKIRKSNFKKEAGVLNHDSTSNVNENLIKLDIETVKSSIQVHETSNDLCNNFIEKLAEFDVAAFLSLPKLCCLLFLLDPINCSDIMTQFLGISDNCGIKEGNDALVGKNLTTDNEEVKYCIRSEFDVYSENNTNDIFETKNNNIFKCLNANRLFLLNYDNKCLNSNEESFKKMVNLWNKLSKAVEIYLYNRMIIKSDEFNEELLLVFIFSALIGECLCGLDHINNCTNCTDKMEIIVKNNKYNDYLKNIIDSLISSIEEVSILMQRIYPSKWNEFIKITTLCLTKAPDITSDEGFQDSCSKSDNDKNIKISDSEGEYGKNNSNNGKLKKLFNNITSIFYSNIRYYGEFTLIGNETDTNTNFLINDEYTYIGNSTNSMSSNSSSSTESNAILLL
ncbi:hypothetical protein FG386_001192 [Cryptosporidium ryanae]|uniref:uncharacterized protein n=1 Tax=Cryptosporidium ryanae TaxID=515981 RepID=UPI00351A2B47|nr:hypothetical protein FG386_001192 [Cryptosporidium ryanae]